MRKPSRRSSPKKKATASSRRRSPVQAAKTPRKKPTALDEFAALRPPPEWVKRSLELSRRALQEVSRKRAGR